MVKKRKCYQMGGEVGDMEDPEYDMEDMEPQQVMFDSTQPETDDNGDPWDDIPWDDERGGPDLSKFKPTLGNVSHRRELDRGVQVALQALASMGIKPSSTNTGKHNVGSKHYHGKAFDLGLNTSFGGDMRKMRDFYENFNEIKKKYPIFDRFTIHDETQRPAGQKVWSGAHLHLQLD
jgi:hypothetical protein